MDTASTAVVVNAHDVSLMSPPLAINDGVHERRIVEQRRSPRVTLAKPLPCFLTGLGRAAIHTISLGGASLVSSCRPRPRLSGRARLVYGDVCVDINLSIYRTVVHELFYSAELGSRGRYLSSVTFDDPSVVTLNLLYQIIGDYWVDPGDDDTTPVEP